MQHNTIGTDSAWALSSNSSQAPESPSCLELLQEHRAAAMGASGTQSLWLGAVASDSHAFDPPSQSLRPTQRLLKWTALRSAYVTR